MVDDTLHPIHEEHDLAQGCKAERRQGNSAAGIGLFLEAAASPPSKCQPSFLGMRDAQTPTPEDVILIVLVSLCPHFDQARQPIQVHELWHQVLVLLQGKGQV